MIFGTFMLAMTCVLRPARTARLLVPAYWWAETDADGQCLTSDFAQLATAGNIAVAVVNPSNGPIAVDSTGYDAFAACISPPRAEGVEIAGYVATKRANETSPGVWEQFGFRAVADVEADLDLWAATGLIDGIFLDEASNIWTASSPSWTDAAASSEEHDAFYSQLFAAVRSRDFRTLYTNPGSPYSTAFLSDVNAPDGVVLFERSHASWSPSTYSASSTCLDSLRTTEQGTFGEGPWCPYVPNWDGVDELKAAIDNKTYPGTAQAALVYGANATLFDARAFVADAVAQGVDLIYVTDLPAWAPWSALPSFWDELVAAHINVYTITTYGAECFFNDTRDDCAVCAEDGCQCGETCPHMCVECLNAYTVASTGAVCFFNSTRSDCAECTEDGCQCEHGHTCVECGAMCPVETTSPAPTSNPTIEPTQIPSKQPSANLTVPPSHAPSTSPTTATPTRDPSAEPTQIPSKQPSANPTVPPSYAPSTSPTSDPSTKPTIDPTGDPSYLPTNVPSSVPSDHPIVPGSPTSEPTDVTTNPTLSPSFIPTYHPSTDPTNDPTFVPGSPTFPPSDETANPSNVPSPLPTELPSQATHSFDAQTSPGPTHYPTMTSTDPSTDFPTLNPTDVPTEAPSSDDREKDESGNVGGNEGSVWWERWYIWLAVVLLSICVSLAVCVVARRACAEYKRRRDAAYLKRITQGGAEDETETRDSEDEEIDRRLEEWAGDGDDGGLAEWAREVEAEDDSAAEKEPFVA